MKDLRTLGLIILLFVFAALGCKWTDRADNALSNAGPEASPSSPIIENSTPSEAGAQFSAPEPLIAELYKQHDANKGPFRERRRAVVDRYFAKPLADLIWKDQQTPPGEMGAIDFDPLYDAQDIDIKKLSVGKPTVSGEKATVPVSFENFGGKKTVTYEMVKQGNAWKISDIKYSGGFTLTGVFRENAVAEKPAEPPVIGEFKGRYRVGDTSCTVRQDRTAFEVKWARGSGSEYFFYKDAKTFESEEDKNGGRNEFRFDDENYNSGTFVRADGKTFPVSRAN